MLADPRSEPDRRRPDLKRCPRHPRLRLPREQPSRDIGRDRSPGDRKQVQQLAGFRRQPGRPAPRGDRPGTSRAQLTVSAGCPGSHLVRAAWVYRAHEELGFLRCAWRPPQHKPAGVAATTGLFPTRSTGQQRRLRRVQPPDYEPRSPGFPPARRYLPADWSPGSRLARPGVSVRSVREQCGATARRRWWGCLDDEEQRLHRAGIAHGRCEQCLRDVGLDFDGHVAGQVRGRQLASPRTLQQRRDLLGRIDVRCVELVGPPTAVGACGVFVQTAQGSRQRPAARPCGSRPPRRARPRALRVLARSAPTAFQASLADAEAHPRAPGPAMPPGRPATSPAARSEARPISGDLREVGRTCRLRRHPATECTSTGSSTPLTCCIDGRPRGRRCAAEPRHVAGSTSNSPAGGRLHEPSGEVDRRTGVGWSKRRRSEPAAPVRHRAGRHSHRHRASLLPSSTWPPRCATGRLRRRRSGHQDHHRGPCPCLLL